MGSALFPGTFNPFTIGHRAIVERGLRIFDRIVIGIGYNREKPSDDIAGRVEYIKEIFKDDPRIEVISYYGLTAETVRYTGCDVILRGVRNVTDFEYERNLADANKSILGVDTIFLISEPKYSHISSSTLRELRDNGYDISAMLGGFREDKNFN